MIGEECLLASQSSTAVVRAWFIAEAATTSCALPQRRPTQKQTVGKLTSQLGAVAFFRRTEVSGPARVGLLFRPANSGLARRGCFMTGSVANSRCGASGVDAEQLIEELGFSSTAGFQQNALQLAHEFNSVERGVRRCGWLEAKHGLNAPFDGTVIGFNLVEIFDLAVVDGVVQQL